MVASGCECLFGVKFQITKFLHQIKWDINVVPPHIAYSAGELKLFVSGRRRRVIFVGFFWVRKILIKYSCPSTRSYIHIYTD